MTASNKTLISLLTAAALSLGALGSVHAQAAPVTAAAGTAQASAEHKPHGHHGHNDHKRGHKHSAEHAKQHAEKRAERQAAFLQKLNLNPAQQAAWAQYQSALHPAAKALGPTKPSADDRKADREAWGKLSTPQRIEARQQQQAQRHALQQARDQATLAFYAQLSPAQQQVFDTESQGRHGKKRHRGKGH